MFGRVAGYSGWNFPTRNPTEHRLDDLKVYSGYSGCIFIGFFRFLLGGLLGLITRVFGFHVHP